MPAFDASSIIHGWVNYPLPHFPKVWDWVAEEITKHHFVIPRIALEETGHRSPECEKWLKELSIKQLAPTQAVLTHAIAMKAALGIVNDKYHPNGVDENDLIIIASAKEANCELVSHEAPQPQLPALKAKYKIPAVCAMQTVKVPCLDFLDLLTRSGRSFG